MKWLRRSRHKPRAGLTVDDSWRRAVDSQWYLATYPEAAASGLTAEDHFVRHGAALGHLPHPLFNGEWYLRRNPDVAAAGADPLLHYVSHGWREGRDPHPLFDTDWYLWRYPDVAASDINPWLHFLTHGRFEWRRPNPLFDPSRYRRHHPGSEASDPLTGFIRDGGREEELLAAFADIGAGFAPQCHNPLTVVLTPNRDRVHYDRFLRSLELSGILQDAEFSRPGTPRPRPDTLVLLADPASEMVPGMFEELARHLQTHPEDSAAVPVMVDSLTGKLTTGHPAITLMRPGGESQRSAAVVTSAVAVDHRAMLAQMAAEAAAREWNAPLAVTAMALACELAADPVRSSRLATLATMAARPNEARAAEELWRSQLVAEPGQPRPGDDLLGRPTSWDHIRAKLIDLGSTDDITSQCARAQQDCDLDTAGELVRQHPGSIIGALTFMLVARRKGALSCSDATGGPIPRSVVQAWFDSPTPSDVAAACRSWEALPGAGWTQEVFDREMADSWLAANSDHRTLEAFRRAAHPATAADLFRLAKLAEDGGVWADADDRCLGPLDPLLTGYDLVLVQEPFGTVAVNFIAARAAHPVLIAAAKEATDAILRGLRTSTWIETGPGALTRSVAWWMATTQATALGAHVVTPSEIARHVVMHQDLEYKATTRSWWLSEASSLASNSNETADDHDRD